MYRKLNLDNCFSRHENHIYHLNALKLNVIAIILYFLIWSLMLAIPHAATSHPQHLQIPMLSHHDNSSNACISHSQTLTLSHRDLSLN